MSEQHEIEAVVEAVLFVASEPVPESRLLELFEEPDRETARRGLAAVIQRYRDGQSDRGRGVMLDEAGGGYRLVTRPELNPYLRKFFDANQSNRLSMAALETLATVAYRQPITAPEIQEVRGKNSAGVLKTLLEKRLIRISGRKDVVGKPFLYATTRDFLLHFGLHSLDDLPPLEEFEEAFLGDGDFAGDGVEKPADREEEVLRQLALLEEREADAGESDDEEAGAPDGDSGDSRDSGDETWPGPGRRVVGVSGFAGRDAAAFGEADAPADGHGPEGTGEGQEEER